MNQFKDVFTGREKRDYARATTAQKCVRAGGKHNDLDNVGYTGRHHTFFEMLGNFSFGDYFKDEAIRFAWELVHGPAEGLRPRSASGCGPPSTPTTTRRRSSGSGTCRAARILRFGEKENFWAMGETGPCGPCSELHYFRGRGPRRQHGRTCVNGPGDDTLEIWNLVFMQFERDASGTMTPLPRPSVDTGAGLERLAAILQGVNNNFDTDLFAADPRAGSRSSRAQTYRGGMAPEDAPFRVIADHVRAATMLIADGALPSNEGRGYVLRRILRRAMRYGRRLGLDRAVPLPARPDGRRGVLRACTSSPRDVAGVAGTVAGVLEPEEERFGRTLSEGADRVGEAIERLRREGATALSGETVFRFYDTYGIPLDVIEEIAGDEGVAVDRAGFEEALERQRAHLARRRRSSRPPTPPCSRGSSCPRRTRCSAATRSRTSSRSPGARVLGAREGRRGGLGCSAAGETGDVVADRTVFYPEGGGQVADTGTWSWEGGAAEVTDVQKPVPNLIAHRVTVADGTARARGGRSTWRSRSGRAGARRPTTRERTCSTRRCARCSATRRARWARSSRPDRLRFDYAAAAATTPEQLAEIERLVNEEILRDQPVTKEVMAMDEARRKGADMFFGEKYGERVRVVEVPGFSTELCGGCHVPRTGEIGAFKIVSDRGLAAGVRRLEAVTSLGAVELLAQDEQILNALSGAAQAPREGLAARWDEREERIKRARARGRLAQAEARLGRRRGAGRPHRGRRRADRDARRRGALDPGAAQPLGHAALEAQERRRRGRHGRRGEDLGHRRA